MKISFKTWKIFKHIGFCNNIDNVHCCEPVWVRTSSDWKCSAHVCFWAVVLLFKNFDLLWQSSRPKEATESNCYKLKSKQTYKHLCKHVSWSETSFGLLKKCALVQIPILIPKGIEAFKMIQLQIACKIDMVFLHWCTMIETVQMKLQS